MYLACIYPLMAKTKNEQKKWFASPLCIWFSKHILCMSPQRSLLLWRDSSSNQGNLVKNIAYNFVKKYRWSMLPVLLPLAQFSRLWCLLSWCDYAHCSLNTRAKELELKNFQWNHQVLIFSEALCLHQVWTDTHGDNKICLLTQIQSLLWTIETLEQFKENNEKNVLYRQCYSQNSCLHIQLTVFILMWSRWLKYAEHFMNIILKSTCNNKILFSIIYI